ncbi:basic proline-rich protein-like [Cinclus cinclus]|uniref:basic proline-rich protein-like n=1 Tax=Cinclus cinclus TaxID=127875 RepID=UPI002E12FF66
MFARRPCAPRRSALTAPPCFRDSPAALPSRPCPHSPAALPSRPCPHGPALTAPHGPAALPSQPCPHSPAALPSRPCPHGPALTAPHGPAALPSQPCPHGPSSPCPHGPALTAPPPCPHGPALTAPPPRPHSPALTAPHRPALTALPSRPRHPALTAPPSQPCPHGPALTAPPPCPHSPALIALPSRPCPHGPATPPSQPRPHSLALTALPSQPRPHGPALTAPPPCPHSPALTALPSQPRPHSPALTAPPSQPCPHGPATPPSQPRPHSPALTALPSRPRHPALTAPPSQPRPHSPALTAPPSQPCPHSPALTALPSRPRHPALTALPSRPCPHGPATLPSQPCPHGPAALGRAGTAPVPPSPVGAVRRDRLRLLRPVPPLLTSKERFRVSKPISHNPGGDARQDACNHTEDMEEPPFSVPPRRHPAAGEQRLPPQPARDLSSLPATCASGVQYSAGSRAGRGGGCGSRERAGRSQGGHRLGQQRPAPRRTALQTTHDPPAAPRRGRRRRNVSNLRGESTSGKAAVPAGPARAAAREDAPGARQDRGRSPPEAAAPAPGGASPPGSPHPPAAPQLFPAPLRESDQTCGGAALGPLFPCPLLIAGGATPRPHGSLPAPWFPVPVIVGRRSGGRARGRARCGARPLRPSPLRSLRGRPSPARARGHRDRHPPPGEDGAGGFDGLKARGRGSGMGFCNENDGIQSKLVDKCRHLPRRESQFTRSSVYASRSGMRGHRGIFKFLKLSLQNRGFLWALFSRRSAFRHVPIPLPGLTGISTLQCPFTPHPTLQNGYVQMTANIQQRMMCTSTLVPVLVAGDRTAPC